MRRLIPSALSTIILLTLSACAKRSYETAKANDQQPAASSSNQNHRININRASAKELEELPGIGNGFADRIVEHREKFGPFRRVEHLIVVRGISEKRFRALREFVTVE